MLWGVLLVRFFFSVYCLGVIRDSLYSVVIVKVRKVRRFSGVNSFFLGGVLRFFIGGRVLDFLFLLRLGLVFLVLVRGIVVVVVDGFRLVLVEVVILYIGLTVLKGLA